MTIKTSVRYIDFSTNLKHSYVKYISRKKWQINAYVHMQTREP